MRPNIILGIESSCDETSAAVVQRCRNGVKLLSNIVSSSLEIQTKYGGVVPEQAAREQLRAIIPVINEVLATAKIRPDQIDAIAVTQGPGLIGSLLVGVETAKTLSLLWQKPIIPINHLLAHFYACWIDTENPPTFPSLGLLVSGGHTELVILKGHNNYEVIGRTRDDAAGECFDKCARLLGYAYPGGPKISKHAQQATDPNQFILPKPMLDSGDFDFSFSGLKTAFLNLVTQNFDLEKGLFNKQTQQWEQKTLEAQLSKTELQKINNLCAALENTIAESLVKKTIAAAQKHNIDQIIISGGVAANQALRDMIQIEVVRNLSRAAQVFLPPLQLCTDNGAVVAATAFYVGQAQEPLLIQATPNLPLG